MRPVRLHVGDGLVEAVHRLHRDDGVEIFGVPVLRGRRDGAGVDPAHGLVAAHFATGGDQRVENAGEDSGDRVAVHQDGLRGAADPRAPHLRVQGDRGRHLRIRRAVDIDVAYAVEMLDHRHAAFFGDARHQRLAAPRHHHVDVVGHRQHFPDRGAVARRNALDRGFGQVRFLQAPHEASMDRGRRLETLGTAAQDRRIARLEAQRARIRGDVGARLVDHADDAQRHAHAADGEAVRARPFVHAGADGVGQRRDRVQPLRHRLHARVVEGQPVEKRALDAALPRALHIGCVGVENRAGVAADRRRRRRQRRVLRFGLLFRQRRRRGARRLAERAHLLAQQMRLDLAGQTHRSPPPAPAAGPAASTRSSLWMISSRPR